MVVQPADVLKLKSKYIRISSEDKSVNSQSNSRFTINLNQTGSNVDRVSAFVVKYISCANIFPNVPLYASNLTLQKQTGNVLYDVPLTVGQYTISEFVTQLEADINAIIPDAVAITQTNNILTFTFTGDNYGFIYDSSTCRDIIGLYSDIPYSAVVSLGVVNLQGETELYVHSKTLNNAGLIEANGSFAVVDILPLDVSFGCVAYSDYNDIQLHEIVYTPYESQKTFRQIDIVLRNRQGNVLELPPNFYFNMLIKIYYT